MCWSADASLLSFIVGCLGIVLAIFKGFSPVMIFFFATIVFMQLVEYVVWTYGVDSPKYIGTGGQGEAAFGRVVTEGDLEASAARRAASPYVNHYASLAAASLLALQPIASILTVSQSYIPIAGYLLFAVIAHFIDRIRNARPLQERYRMTSEPQLVWHWLTPTPLFSLIVYFLFLLTPLVLSQQFALLAAVLAALAFSILSYSRAWGSVWCYAIHCIVVLLCVR
jgi:hypothetical protein